MTPSKPKAVEVSRIDYVVKVTDCNGNNIIYGCEQFKELFGITIRKGQCLKVEFKARVIR